MRSSAITCLHLWLLFPRLDKLLAEVLAQAPCLSMSVVRRLEIESACLCNGPCACVVRQAGVLFSAATKVTSEC